MFFLVGKKNIIIDEPVRKDYLFYLYSLVRTMGECDNDVKNHLCNFKSPTSILKSIAAGNFHFKI